MKIRHVSFLPKFIDPIIFGRKKTTIRPIKPQPNQIYSGILERRFSFGSDLNETEIYFEDYPCPYGSQGELLMMYSEGNSNHFYESKCIEVSSMPLFNIDEYHAKIDGFETLDEFKKQWDEIYGETEFAYRFNPFVWVVQWL